MVTGRHRIFPLFSTPILVPLICSVCTPNLFQKGKVPIKEILSETAVNVRT